MSNFRETKRWDASKVRSMCIKYDRYTRGDCAAYNRMLSFVDSNEPTLENMQWVAEDIVEHSDMDRYGMDFDELVEGVMFDLANDAVTYFFERI